MRHLKIKQKNYKMIVVKNVIKNILKTCGKTF